MLTSEQTTCIYKYFSTKYTYEENYKDILEIIER